MGECASKRWEIDLRDTCQRLRCFFACCKGHIIVTRLLKLKAQNLNPKSKMIKRFMTPVLFGLIPYFFAVQPDVERLHGS